MGNRFSKKKKEMTLSQEAASQMLANVFEACGCEANHVPLEVLRSWGSCSRQRYAPQKCVIAAVALVFALTPMLFVTPEVRADWLEGAAPGSPVLELEADSFLPVESVRASMDAQELSVYRVEKNVYQIRPDRNGTLVITVTLVNNQSTETLVEVDGVDVTPPTLLGSTLNGDELEIFLSDDSGELDYDGIYAVDAYGNTVYPLRCDRESMSVVFAYPEDAMTIYVPDKSKNILQMELTIEKAPS